MKKVVNKILIILFSFILILASGCNLSRDVTNAWLESSFDYFEFFNGDDLCEFLDETIPLSNEIGTYKKATFYEYENAGLSFYGDSSEHAFCLVVEYDSKNYATEKQKALQNYEFQTEVVVEHGKDYALPFYERVIGDYNIKIIKDFFYESGFMSAFPQFIGMVAYSDAKMQIIYCFLYHSSLDLFRDADHMEQYIKNGIPLNW